MPHGIIIYFHAILPLAYTQWYNNPDPSSKPDVNYPTIYASVLYFVVLTLGLLALVASGVQLSPINIDTTNTLSDPSPLNINSSQAPQVNGILTNTGGIIKFVPDSSQPNLLGTRYILQEIVFHWESTSAVGSEHQVDGTQFAAEIQFVHRKLGAPRAYSIVAVLCAVSESSTGVSGVWSQLNPIPTTGSRRVTGISYADLLPGTQGYYRYSGSRTISPYEDVEWLVMKDTIDIPNGFLNNVQPSNRASLTNHNPQIFEHP